MLVCVYIFSLLLNLNAQSTDQPFNIGIRLLRPIVATVENHLQFPDTDTGSSKMLVVDPTDSSAVVVKLTGSRSRSITSTVVEDSVLLTSSSSEEEVLVDGFTVDGAQALDSNGKAKLSVGAVAHINPSHGDGSYLGYATLRVTYQ